MRVGLSVGKLRDCLITESPMTAEAFFRRNTSLGNLGKSRVYNETFCLKPPCFFFL